MSEKLYASIAVSHYHSSGCSLTKELLHVLQNERVGCVLWRMLRQYIAGQTAWRATFFSNKPIFFMNFGQKRRRRALSEIVNFLFYSPRENDNFDDTCQTTNFINFLVL